MILAIPLYVRREEIQEVLDYISRKMKNKKS